MTGLSWVAPHDMAHSFVELDKVVVHVIRLVSFLWLWFSSCLPSGGERSEAYGSFLMGERGKLDLVLMAMLSKSLIQFSVDGWSCVPSIPIPQVKWALGSITTNKASGGDGIPVGLKS